MYKTCSGYERFTSHFLNFQSVSSIQACLRKLIDLNDAWVWDGSIMKQAAVDLNTRCFQGQRGEESVNLTKIQLHQHSVSLDSSICPAVTLALSPPPLSLSVCLILSFKCFSSWLSFTISHLHSVSLGSIASFLSPSREIQYLSQPVWVHSPLSLGELPLAPRWISVGLIDITLVMKYAYHDQRWWQERRHLYKSSQPGVAVLVETVSSGGSHCVKLQCYK